LTEKFVPIQMRMLQEGRPFGFDLYVKINKKHILYLRNGDSLEDERLAKLKGYKGERFFINKSDLPIFKDFVGVLLDETLEEQTLIENKKDSQAEPLQVESQVEDEGLYFNFKDSDQAEKKSAKSKSSSNENVKLSPQIKSMMAQQSSGAKKQENPEQKLQRQVEVINSVAKTAIDVINRILKGPDSLIAYQLLQKSAESLRQALEKGPRYFSKLYHIEVSEETPLIAHSKNVAVLAVRLGMTQRLSNEQLNHLAIAAMIHDIGLTQIPEEQNPIELFSTPKDDFSLDQRKLHLAHVENSVKLIEEKDFIPKSIIDLIENHEENLSGLGPLENTQLSVEQQILSLANRFEKYMRVKNVSPQKGIQELAINELGNYDLKLIESLKKMAATLTPNAKS